MLVGTITWLGDKTAIRLRWDKIAIYGSELVCLSAVGTTGDVKGFRAAINANSKSYLKLVSPDLGVTDGAVTWAKSFDACYSLEQRYAVYTHRLGYDTMHAVFVAQLPGLLLNGSDDGLWQQLKSDRYTTPLLRPWVPYLKRQLIECKLLQCCACYDCDCWVLTATSNDLDGVVSTGLKEEHLSIEEATHNGYAD